MDSVKEPGLPSRQRLAAHLALLLGPNKRKLAGAVIIAAAGSYAVIQHQAKQTRRRKHHQSKAADKPGSSTSNASGGRSKKRPSGHALRELIPLLLKVAGRKVIVIALLAIARTALSNRLARLQGYLFRAAFLRKVPLFARNIAENIVLCAVASGLESTSKSWVSYMELQWRRLLTGRLHNAYFDDMVRRRRIFMLLL